MFILSKIEVENRKVAYMVRGIENSRQILESLKMTQCFDSVVTRRENTYKNMALARAVSEQKVIRK